MIDIISSHWGEDLGVLDDQAPRATNILSVQLGALEYAQELGIDLAYFLSEGYAFQNESFKAYTIQVLANFGINVATLLETVESLNVNYAYNLTPVESESNLIAR